MRPPKCDLHRAVEALLFLIKSIRDNNTDRSKYAQGKIFCAVWWQSFYPDNADDQ